jgi:hypothetical protein
MTPFRRRKTKLSHLRERDHLSEPPLHGDQAEQVESQPFSPVIYTDRRAVAQTLSDSRHHSKDPAASFLHITLHIRYRAESTSGANAERCRLLFRCACNEQFTTIPCRGHIFRPTPAAIGFFIGRARSCARSVPRAGPQPLRALRQVGHERGASPCHWRRLSSCAPSRSRFRIAAAPPLGSRRIRVGDKLRALVFPLALNVS